MVLGFDCEICNYSMASDPSAEKALGLDGNEPFNIIRCSNCGFRKLTPIPEQGFLEEIYTSGYFEDLKRGFSYSSQVKETQYAFRYTAEKFRTLLNGEGLVLDIGCATGEFIEELNNVELKAKGIEYSEYGMQACKKKGLDIIKGDMFQADYEGLLFDGIHISHVLEHLPDPNEAIKQLKKWVKPGGWIYIEVPLQFDGLLEKFQSYRKPPKTFDIFSIHHCSFFSPHSLRILLEKHGLTEYSLSTYNPNKRKGRKNSVRKIALSIFLTIANLFERGDIIGIWVKAP